MGAPDTFDPAAVLHVNGEASVAALPPDTQSVLLYSPSDSLLAALVARVPDLHHLITDGNGRAVTDQGLVHLRQLPALETLDLEWSAVTDHGLALLADLRSLRWVDVGGAAGITPSGIAALRTSRPDLEVEAHGR